MKYDQTIFRLMIIAIAVQIISGCDKDDDNNNPGSPVSATGAFVVNEGAYGGGNSSVSFLDFSTGIMHNGLFAQSNGFPLGDVAQSMIIEGNTGYIVVNNSQKVEVVNLDDLSVKATITGFQGPRYMAIAGGKGFVSDWFSNKVCVVNLVSNTIVKQIPAGNGPDQLLFAGNRLFVCNIGGWGTDSTVTVIDPVNGSVITTLTVGINPNSIVADKNGKIWILCGGSTGPDFTGGTPDDIAGTLVRIDPTSVTIEKNIPIPAFLHPLKLTINGAGDRLWYLLGSDGYYGQVTRMNIADTLFQTNPLINRMFYGLGVDPESGIVYCGHAPSFSQNGYLIRFLASGTPLDSMEAGIAPNGFCFR
jgi:hypothetical protein